MLDIYTDKMEVYDEASNAFTFIPKQHLQLEHSLIAVAKWESRWKIPFLTDKEKTSEQMLDYIRCMTVNKNVDPMVYYALQQKDLDAISNYIKDPMTATTFFSRGKNHVAGRHEVKTAELIYYDMIQFGVPFECEKWHLNRLMTLLRVCMVKSSGGKKMSKAATAKMYSEMNAARRKKLNTKG